MEEDLLSLKKINGSRVDMGTRVRTGEGEVVVPGSWGMEGGGGKGYIKKVLASWQVGGGISLQGSTPLGVGLRVPILPPVANT